MSDEVFRYCIVSEGDCVELGTKSITLDRLCEVIAENELHDEQIIPIAKAVLRELKG